MVEVTHVLVGVAIATKTANPALALPLAFASHFVLDLIPHWNPHIYTQMKKFGRVNGKTTALVALDSFLSLLIGLLFTLQKYPDLGQMALIVLGAFFAVLPDLLEAPYYFLGTRHPLIVKLVDFEHSLQTKAPLIPGILTQVAVAGAAVWWILS